MYAEQPIFIVAAPRSGSTLLFETLMRHQQLWSFGDEGHGWIEKYPQLRPLPGGVASNRLTAEHLTANLTEKLRQDMLAGVINVDGNPVTTEDTPIRLLEKTPKNCLRIPFIDSIYPDARYIYLYRDPKDSISSIMEGWRHQQFVTYADVITAHGFWCFLRPPGWQNMINRPLHEIAAFQWHACQNIILDDLREIETNRWMVSSFDEFLADTPGTVARMQAFAGLADDKNLAAHCSSPLPLSRYTQTKPEKDKWRQHGDAITRLLPALTTTMTRINEVCEPDWKLNMALPANTGPQLSAGQHKTGRNDPCPCGSGRKYKQCHGAV